MKKGYKVVYQGHHDYLCVLCVFLVYFVVKTSFGNITICSTFAE